MKLVAARWVPRALIVCALFVFHPASANDCPSGHIDSTARVVHVIDGDTVILKDGRHVRLIGIDTPEIGRRGKPSQPYATAARKALISLLSRSHDRVELRYGKTRKDHYHRTLAHLFLPDGASVSAYLLRNGLATALVMPPDVWNANCYASQEQYARKRKIGLWSLSRYQPYPPRMLPAKADGFYVIRGRVMHVGQSRHARWINLENKMAIRIPNADLRYFQGMDFARLKGRMITAQGWVHTWSKGDRVMEVRYPTAIWLD